MSMFIDLDFDGFIISFVLFVEFGLDVPILLLSPLALEIFYRSYIYEESLLNGLIVL